MELELERVRAICCNIEGMTIKTHPNPISAHNFTRSNLLEKPQEYIFKDENRLTAPDHCYAYSLISFTSTFLKIVIKELKRFLRPFQSAELLSSSEYKNISDLLFYAVSTNYPPSCGTSFEEEMLKCSGTVYVDVEKEGLADMRLRLLRLSPKTFLYQGREPLFQRDLGLKVQELDWDQGVLRESFQRVLQSGLMEFWNGLVEAFKVRDTLVGSSRGSIDSGFSPLRLHSNLIAVFTVYSICVSLCLCALAWENYKNIYEALLRFCSIVFKLACALRRRLRLQFLLIELRILSLCKK
jgi:hypothetical protein